MIILTIIALSAVVLSLVMVAISNLPTIPPEVVGYITQMMPYIVRGVKYINYFCYAPVVVSCVTVTLLVGTAYRAYKLVMWITKKIPMFGVSD